MNPAFTDAAWRDVFGVTKAKDRRFAEDVVAALGRIDPSLVPSTFRHPFAKLVALGTPAVDALIDHVEADDRALEALDALDQVFVHARAPAPAVARLRALLQASQDPLRTAALARTLAIGRDEQLLFDQMRALADPDPGLVAAAAQLLGFGRYRVALPVLKALVSPTRFFESRQVIWALGEIGDGDALPVLQTALSNTFRVPECLVAVGKIRSAEGVPLVLPWAVHGLPDQRDAGWGALASILDAERDAPAVRAIADDVAAIIDAQLAAKHAELSPASRLRMLLCLARLGRKMPPERVMRVLGVDAPEASTLSQLMLRR